MTLFSSKRERILWILLLTVVVAIYSTLGLAATLEEILRESAFGGVFFVGFLLIWVAVLIQGLRFRAGGAEIGVMLGIAAVYLMLFARLGIAERTHLFEYGVVAILIYEALTERASQGRTVPVPALLAVLAASLIGVIDECIQLFLPSRVFDPVDMAFNSFAAFLTVIGMAALGWARRRVDRFRQSS